MTSRSNSWVGDVVTGMSITGALNNFTPKALVEDPVDPSLP